MSDGVLRVGTGRGRRKPPGRRTDDTLLLRESFGLTVDVAALSRTRTWSIGNSAVTLPESQVTTSRALALVCSSTVCGEALICGDEPPVCMVGAYHPLHDPIPELPHELELLLTAVGQDIR